VEIAHDSRFYMELLTITSARRLAFLNTPADGAGVREMRRPVKKRSLTTLYQRGIDLGPVSGRRTHA